MNAQEVNVQPDDVTEGDARDWWLTGVTVGSALLALAFLLVA